MVAIDSLEGAEFEPLRQKLRPRTAYKTTNICSTHAKPAETKIEQHGCCKPKMIPGAAVVARPRSGIPLATGITGARQNEGPLIGRKPQQSIIGRPRILHSVDIVNLEVVCRTRLEAPLINPVLHIIGHGHFGSVKDRRLVHVIPEPGYAVMNELRIERAPPFARALACEVGKHRRSRPDLADIN